MKDIKINNTMMKPKSEVVGAFSYVHTTADSGKGLGKFMLTSMIVSIFVYLFFVTSTIYYAINIQSYEYDINELNAIALEIGYANSSSNNEFTSVGKPLTQNNKKEKISYINRNANTTISLK